MTSLASLITNLGCAIGYTKCWKYEAFIQEAMEHADEFRVLVDEKAELVTDNTPIDDEALSMAGPLLDV